ncbi:MAG: purple acid phosphatase family protein [Armatimonadota bacterium]
MFCSRSARLLLAALAIATCGLAGFAKILMPPYLQAVTTNSVYVLVECDSPTPVTVEYGTRKPLKQQAVTESAVFTEATPPTYVHRIKLTGLKANSSYLYRAKQDGAPTADASFVTAVLPGTPFRFAWMADTRTQTAVHAQVAKRILDANPRMSIYGGDLCGNGSYDLFKKEFFLPEELALASRVPFFNAVGNHEGWSMDTKAFTHAPASPSGTTEYYSFDYGDVHFLALNTELSYAANSPQYKFAAADLAASKQPWKVVFMHKHPYIGGGHGEDKALQEMAQKLFVPNNVNLVFSGHSHFYQHNLVDGIHYLIIGSAGAPLYDPGTAPYTIKSAKDYNYGIIDVTPTTLRLLVNNAEGKELETLDVTK